MLNLVSAHDIKAMTNLFNWLKKISVVVELAHSGKMKGKAVVLTDEEAIENKRNQWSR